MSRYEFLISKKGSGSVIDTLKPVSRERIALVCAQYPSLPEDYLQFLVEVGYGGIGMGNAHYMLYDGVVETHEVFGERSELEGILLFGDDFAGCNAGFDVRTWRVVEIDSGVMDVYEIAETFSAFITEKIREIETY